MKNERRERRTVIAQVGRIENAALALVSGVSDPDGTQPKALLFQFFQEFLIERLIEFLVSISTHRHDISRVREGRTF